MLVLHLVVLPERVRCHARELQLGLRAVRWSDGVRYPHVRFPRQACLRGAGSEGDNGGFGIDGGVVEVLGVVSLLCARNADRSLCKPHANSNETLRISKKFRILFCAGISIQCDVRVGKEEC